MASAIISGGGGSPFTDTTTVNDDVLFRLGTDGDVGVVFNTSALSADEELTGVIAGTSDTGAVTASSLLIGNTINDGDISFYFTNSSNSLHPLLLDASVPQVVVNPAGTDMDFEVDITGGGIGFKVDGGTGDVFLKQDGVAATSGRLLFGAGDDVEMFFDGTNFNVNLIPGTGGMIIDSGVTSITNPTLKIVNQRNNADAWVCGFYGNRGLANAANNDKINIDYFMSDDAQAVSLAARNTVKFTDVTTATRTAAVQFYSQVSNSLDLFLTLDGANDSVVIGKPITLSTTAGITAYAGGGQPNATQLTDAVNQVTTVGSAGDSVKLPAAVAGKQIIVCNGHASNSMDVFPATGDYIASLAVDTAIPISAGSAYIFTGANTSNWYTA